MFQIRYFKVLEFRVQSFQITCFESMSVTDSFSITMLVLSWNTMFGMYRKVLNV